MKFQGIVHSPSRQQGATLIEIAMVIGVIALISIAAVVAYNSTMEGRRIETATTNLGNVVGCVRNLFGAQGHYADLSNATVIKAHCLADGWHNGTDEINHPWADDAVTVTPATGSTPRTFTVAYEGMSEGACVKLASTTLGNAVSISIGTEAAGNVADIVENCADGVDVTWTFN